MELRHGLGVEIGESKLDKENLPEIEDTVSVCAGLVTVDEQSDIIRFVHYTTQEYFERTQTTCFPNAQADIAKICITYLSFNEFESGFCPTREALKEQLQLNALYDYAAQNWGHHAHAASIEKQLILNFLKSEAKVSISSQAMMTSRSYQSGNVPLAPRQTMGAHLVAYFGLREVMIALLKNGHDPNFKDTNGQTPLSWAAENGHEAVVKLLLEKGAELESKDSKDASNGWTPLSWAAYNGHEAVAKLLLKKGAELESKDTYTSHGRMEWCRKATLLWKKL